MLPISLWQPFAPLIFDLAIPQLQFLQTRHFYRTQIVNSLGLDGIQAQAQLFNVLPGGILQVEAKIFPNLTGSQIDVSHFLPLPLRYPYALKTSHVHLLAGKHLWLRRNNLFQRFQLTQLYLTESMAVDDTLHIHPFFFIELDLKSTKRKRRLVSALDGSENDLAT